MWSIKQGESERWEKERKKEWKNRGRETNRGCFGATRHRVHVSVHVFVSGGHSGDVGGHGGRDQSFGAGSTGNRDDGEWMEVLGEGRRGERKGCGQFGV